MSARMLFGNSVLNRSRALERLRSLKAMLRMKAKLRTAMISVTVPLKTRRRSCRKRRVSSPNPVLPRLADLVASFSIKMVR